MDENLRKLVTEQMNQSTKCIDRCSTKDMLYLLNQEDKKVPYAVEKELDHIAEAVDAIAEKIRLGGRLFYVGAGTSGRLGYLDASECPPTFGVDDGMVQAIIAGGETALGHSVEGAEDDEDGGRRILDKYGIDGNDVVVGITASGRTPFVLAAVGEADKRGILTVGISNNKNSLLESLSRISISVQVGPEAIKGSTRLKAGTAQKLILNMISTGVMIKLGKVYGNLMVCMKPTNHKLVERSKQIIQTATGVDYETAQEYFDRADGNIKAAIVMVEKKCSLETALSLLEESGEYVAYAVERQ